MTNDDDIELPAELEALLAEDDLWTPVPEETQASIVAAVMDEVGAAEAGAAEVSAAEEIEAHDEPASDSVVTPMVRPQAAARTTPEQSRWASFALGAAAALLLVAGIFGVARLGGSSPDLKVELAGTDLAPAASAIAEVTSTPNGTRIVIEVNDLPPAPPGTYYEAWLRKDTAIGVSAGTFHLRGGGGTEIELWAGVTPDEFPLLTVTLQDEAQPESSGQVVLKALLDG